MIRAKILIVINDISASGGTERVAAFLANNLSKNGFEITLVSRLSHGDPFYELNSAVKLDYLNSTSIWRLGKYLKQHKFDSIISVSMGRLSFEISLLCSILFIKSRLILSEHVSFEVSNLAVRLAKLISYLRSDHLVLLTKHDLNIINKYIKNKISVIRNACNYPVLTTESLSKKQKIVLAVGRLTHQKGFSRLIDIWAKLPKNLQKEWMLNIVGDGEEYEELSQKINLNNLASSIKLMPATKDIHVEYEHASILAMTSHYEGLPLVLIEAKSFGLPAIAFDCKTGPKEIINDGVDGFLIPENNIELFTSKLILLMKDKNKLLNMQNLSLLSSRDYSEEKIVDQWIDIL